MGREAIEFVPWVVILLNVNNDGCRLYKAAGREKCGTDACRKRNYCQHSGKEFQLLSAYYI